MSKISKISIISDIREAYSRGENIMRYLNSSTKNSLESILISYDLQTGSYIDGWYKNNEKLEAYTSELSQHVSKYSNGCKSILEAGIGEGTTFSSIIQKCELFTKDKYGFDISWSRSLFANAFLQSRGVVDSKIFVGNIYEIPLSDDSIDIVYTSHAMEPNGGREEEILKELYRITKKFLILFEPDYSLASPEGKERMEFHGYVKDLYGTAKRLKYQIVDYSPIKDVLNKFNPTSVLVIKKEKPTSEEPKKCYRDVSIFECPVTKTPLDNLGEIYFSQEACLMYPVVRNIPYLLSSHAMLGSKYKTEFKDLAWALDTSY